MTTFRSVPALSGIPLPPRPFASIPKTWRAYFGPEQDAWKNEARLRPLQGWVHDDAG